MADSAGTLPKPEIVKHATLMQALCAAQLEFESVVKDTKGARGTYAPLDNVIASVRPALNKNGLVLIQPVRLEENLMMVDTSIVHAATGERLSCPYPVSSLGKPHQDMGAALTYARRYSLLTLLGVFPEDEDNDGATAGDTGQRTQRDGTQTAHSLKKDGEGEWLKEAIAALRGPGDADELRQSERWLRIPSHWKTAAEDAIEARLEILATEAANPPREAEDIYQGLLKDLGECASMSSYIAWKKTLTRDVLKQITPEHRKLLEDAAEAKKSSFEAN